MVHRDDETWSVCNENAVCGTNLNACEGFCGIRQISTQRSAAAKGCSLYI